MKLYEMPELSDIQRSVLEYSCEEVQDDERIKYNINLIPFQTRAIYFALKIKSFRAEIEAREKEIALQKEKCDSLKKQIAWCESMVEQSCPDKEKINDHRVTISWRKSESIEVNDNFHFCEEYDEFWRHIPAKYEPDKAKLKKHIKATGETFPGVELVAKMNLRVK